MTMVNRPLPESLATANMALRECLDALVIDYVRGELQLQWRHGAKSTLLYGSLGFPKVDKRAA